MAGYKDVVFHSTLGRGLAVVVIVVGVLPVTAAFLNGGPMAGLTGVVVWAVVVVAVYFVFWRPRLEVLSDKIVVVNPFRTHVISWPSIESVENRWMLTIVTDTESVPVWAVPRPSTSTRAVGVRRDAYGMPDYNAEKSHQGRDGNVNSANAALTVIESRLRSR